MDENEILIQISADRLNQRSSNRIAVGCILLYQCFESIVYFTIYFNLIIVISKSHLGITSTDAATVSFVFAGFGYILTIVGGVVADSVAGEYNTLYGSGFIYIIGLYLHAVVALNDGRIFGSSYTFPEPAGSICFYCSLACISVATGGINANIGNFGTRQLTHLRQVSDRKFFCWLYWCKNVGGLVAVILIQRTKFYIGLIICFAVMFVAQIVLLFGKRYYATIEPEGSVLVTAIKVCWNTRCVYRNLTKNYKDKDLTRTRRLVKVLPIFGLILIYWTVYAQMQTTYLLQAARLDFGANEDAAINNPTTLGVFFNPAIIVILIPVKEIVVYPLLSKLDKLPSLLKKLGIGMIFATASVLVAGIVEVYRKKDISIDQKILDRHYNASSLPVYVQIPQFVFIGISEIFTSIGGLEFAHSEAPEDMKGVMMGLFISTQGFGTLLAAALLNVLKASDQSNKTDSWFPNNLNKGRWEFYFFLLALLSMLNFLCFIGVSHFYKYGGNLTMVENDDPREDDEFISNENIPSLITNDSEE